MTTCNRQELDELLRHFYHSEIHCGGDCAACKFGVRPGGYLWFTCPVKVVRKMVDLRYSDPDNFDDIVG